MCIITTNNAAPLFRFVTGRAQRSQNSGNVTHSRTTSTPTVAALQPPFRPPSVRDMGVLLAALALAGTRAGTARAHTLLTSGRLRGDDARVAVRVAASPSD